MRATSLVVHQNPVGDIARRSGGFEVRGCCTIWSNGRHAGVAPRYIRHLSKMLIRPNLREVFHESEQALSRQGPRVLLAERVHERPIQSWIGPSARPSRSGAAPTERVTRPQDPGLVLYDIRGLVAAS